MLSSCSYCIYPELILASAKATYAKENVHAAKCINKLLNDKSIKTLPRARVYHLFSWLGLETLPSAAKAGISLALGGEGSAIGSPALLCREGGLPGPHHAPRVALPGTLYPHLSPSSCSRGLMLSDLLGITGTFTCFRLQSSLAIQDHHKGLSVAPGQLLVVLKSNLHCPCLPPKTRGRGLNPFRHHTQHCRFVPRSSLGCSTLFPLIPPALE